MPIENYLYPVDQCDVDKSRQKALDHYRQLRSKCLEAIRGSAENSIANQIHQLTWNSAVFHALNEARRIESERKVNGAMWNLIVDGYAHIAALGIRRLVDHHKDSNSIKRVLLDLEANKHLISREMFVCYDGLSYDHEAAELRRLAARDPKSLGKATWISTTGPDAGFNSKLRHDIFDSIADGRRKAGRSQPISAEIFDRLKAMLNSDVVKKVCTMADKVFAHPEKRASGVPVQANYHEVIEALGIVSQVTQFISATLLDDAAFGSLVATPQGDVFEHLDQAWVRKASIDELNSFWNDLTASLDLWLDTDGLLKG
ncbi:hypothetical protein [Pseudomonas violetae]|uniref:HEPN AbiU2-like domain-containing protein n=1 Tax=Pseudomonas violetae TaxID=2915813 RepID=A0ABT0EV98_9PSED|nr:hypothetical protein [Pseudomonas violetae]MCK1789625.1 hypothetical protein [Pseudomonas violetae]